MKPKVFVPADLPPVTPDLDRYGVLGFPVSHSLSPAMQEAGFRALGLSAEYLRVEIAEGALSQALPRLRQAGFLGWNCTLPHKEAMFTLCSETDASARECGSVNTVRVTPQGLFGSSTDADGWEDAVAKAWNLNLPGQRVLILGCGGVGRTLAFRLVKRGCRSLAICNRDGEKASRLAKELQSRIPIPISTPAWDSPELSRTIGQSDLLIQATRLGLASDDPLPVPVENLHPALKVYDTVYRKDFTPLIQAARARGIPSLDGLGMLLFQGARALSLWTGKPAPLAVMQAALESSAGRSL